MIGKNKIKINSLPHYSSHIRFFKMKVFNFLEYCTIIYPALRANIPNRPVYLISNYITIAGIFELFYLGIFFIFLEAETFDEYVETALSIIRSIFFSIFYFMITLNRDGFMEIFDQLQEIVDKSKIFF